MKSTEHLERLEQIVAESLAVADDYWRAVVEETGYPDPSAIEMFATARKLQGQVEVLRERYSPKGVAD